MRPVTRDAAVIVVAQRVSSIIHADRIVVLDDGARRRPGHARGAARELPDVRRDRGEPAGDGGGGMSEQLKTEEEQAAEERRGPAAARRGGPPHCSIGVPTEKSQDFVPSAKRVLRLLHPERFIVWGVVALAVASVVLSAIGPKILGGATDLIFAGVFGSQIPAGVTQEQAVDALRARGEDSLADMLAAMDHVVPGQGIDFDALGRGAPLRARALRRRRPAAVAAGVDAHGRRQPHDLPAASGRRGQAQPPPPALLRPPAARRAAQPGHQRHRQRRTEPPADPEPAAHLAAHGRRDGRDDDLDLAAARPHRPRDDPDHDGRHGDDRQAQPEALRAAVEEHRRGQRRRRGDLHRPRARQGLRPAAGGRRGSSPSATTRCTTRASGRSSSAASSCRR